MYRYQNIVQFVEKLTVNLDSVHTRSVSVIMHETQTRGLRSDRRFTSDYHQVGMSECRELKWCSVRPVLCSTIH